MKPHVAKTSGSAVEAIDSELESMRAGKAPPVLDLLGARYEHSKLA